MMRTRRPGRELGTRPPSPSRRHRYTLRIRSDAELEARPSRRPAPASSGSRRVALLIGSLRGFLISLYFYRYTPTCLKLYHVNILFF